MTPTRKQLAALINGCQLEALEKACEFAEMGIDEGIMSGFSTLAAMPVSVRTMGERAALTIAVDTLLQFRPELHERLAQADEPFTTH